MQELHAQRRITETVENIEHHVPEPRMNFTQQVLEHDIEGRAISYDDPRLKFIPPHLMV
jgi:hypothetical protein